MSGSSSSSAIIPYLKQWLALLVQEGKSAKTVNAYRRAVHHFVQWHRLSYGESFTPEQVIERDMRDWQSYQRRVTKNAPATINQRATGVRAYFHYLNEHHGLSRDPTTALQPVTKAKQQPQSLTRKQLRRLLKAVHQGGDERDIAIIELLAGSGLRVGELLDLQIGDVVIEPRSGWVTVREGKKGSYRQIPLTKDVRRAVQKWLDRHPLYRKEDAKPQQIPLWVSKYGPLKHRSSISRLIEKYALRARLETVTPHMLRHTFATLYLQANPNDVRGLAALLGHRNLNTIMVYTEPSLAELSARMARIDDALIDE
ncbi:MAG: tyrosine-type recombinase/integrase [Anaerolineae bacterium]|nr:tyrosine-type recombinase/integrase [Anaerolineae bacterium]